MLKRFSAAMAGLLLLTSAFSDTISIGSETYKDVYIVNSGGFYHVLLPETGESTKVSIRRADVTVELTEDRSEREALKETWDAKQASRSAAKDKDNSDKDNSAGGTTVERKRRSMAEYQDRRAQRELAAFETALEVWRTFDEEQRLAIISVVAAEGDASIRDRLSRAGSLAARREILGEVKESVGALDKKADTIAEAKKAAALEDSSLEWNREMLESTLIRRTAQDLTGNHNPHTDTTVLRYQLEYESDLAKVQQEVSSIEKERREAKKVAERKLVEIENAKRRLGAEQYHLQLTAEERAHRTLATLAFQFELENALASGYKEQIHYIPIHEVLHESKEWGAVFETSNDFIRVRWLVDDSLAGSRAFRISIYNADSGQLVTGATDKVYAYNRFLILEGPARYKVKVENGYGGFFSVWIDAPSKENEGITQSRSLAEQNTRQPVPENATQARESLQSIATLVQDFAQNVSTSNGQNQQSSESIESEIRKFAHNEYPNDESMQKYVYNQQIAAFNYMQSVDDFEVTEYARYEYPHDYSMQKFVYDQQLAAKRYMGTVADQEVKGRSIREYPNDYSMQKFTYDQQLAAKEYMASVGNGAAAQKARREYPNDYTMQKYIYERGTYGR